MRDRRHPILRPTSLAFALAALLAVAAMAEVVAVRGLNISLPDSWQRETPSSSMRAAQARVPGSGGDGQFTVFHFGPGGGGGVEANIARWIGQMNLEGSQPYRDQFTVGNLRVHWVDAEGTLLASRIGAFPPTDQPGYRLLGAVVEGEGGPWFLRLIGPQKTLAEQHEAFRGMLRQLGR